MQGLRFNYIRRHKKTTYELAYRLFFKKGLKSSQLITLVKTDLAEKLALDNYNNSQQ